MLTHLSGSGAFFCVVSASSFARAAAVSRAGLFAGGGLDVMTAFLLRAMPDRFETPQSRIDRPDAKRRTPFAVLDYCAGSGVLAAAVPQVTRGPGVRCSFLAAAVPHVTRGPVVRCSFLAAAVPHVTRRRVVR